MTTTTGDPRIDQNEKIQSWIEVGQRHLENPTPDLFEHAERVRQYLRDAGVSRWTSDLRAVLWAGFLAALYTTTVREWNTCHTVREDYLHWASHHHDKWSFYAAALVLIDAEGTI
jgi:hypothetical protein